MGTVFLFREKEFPGGHFMTIYRQQDGNQLLHALIGELLLNVLFTNDA